MGQTDENGIDIDDRSRKNASKIFKHLHIYVSVICYYYGINSKSEIYILR